MSDDARFVRLGETGRAEVRLTIDGRETRALEGDTLLVALLANGTHLRHSEFGSERRAGFCLMSACQDCWVSDDQGNRFRSCTTPVRNGMAIRTTREEATWPNLV